MKPGHLISLLTVSLFLIGNANAQDCGKARKILKDIHNVSKQIAHEAGCLYVKAQAGVPTPLCKTALKMNDKFKSLKRKIALKAWNKAVKNSWATIGPRELSFKKRQKGKLVSLGGRMFVTKSATAADEVKITVQKTGKSGKAGVAICVTNPKTGQMKVIKKHTFKKSKKKSTWTYTVKRAAGRAIMVHLKGKSAGRGFPYSVSAKEIFK